MAKREKLNVPLSERLSLTIAEVAALTGLSTSTVSYLTATGALPCWRIVGTKRVLIPRDALMELLERSRTGGRAG